MQPSSGASKAGSSSSEDDDHKKTESATHHETSRLCLTPLTKPTTTTRGIAGSTSTSILAMRLGQQVRGLRSASRSIRRRRAVGQLWLVVLPQPFLIRTHGWIETRITCADASRPATLTHTYQPYGNRRLTCLPQPPAQCIFWATARADPPNHMRPPSHPSTPPLPLPLILQQPQQHQP